ncbi:O15 family O-antigen flippase [Escherichia coli]
MSKTKLNVLYLAISQGANYLLPLLIFPYLVRVIGVSNFGDLSFSLITIQVLLMVVEYGFGYSGTREIALNNDKKYHSEFFCGVVLARFILMLIAAIILIILCFFYVFNDVKYLLCVGFLSVIAGVFNPNWFLQGKEMMSVMAVLSLFSRGIAVVAVYLIIKPATPMYISALLLSMPYILYSFCGVAYLLIIKEIFLCRPPIKKIQVILKNGFHFFCSTLATSAYTMLPPLVLGGVSGKFDVGIFNSANMIKQGLAGLASPLVQAFYPRINILQRENPYIANLKSRMILKYLLVFYMALAMPFLLFANQLSLLIFGMKGEVIAGAMQLMTLLPIFIGFNTVVGLLVLVPNGMQKQYFKSIFLGTITCLSIVYPACKYYGATGAIVSLIVAEIFVGMGMLKQFIKVNKTVCRPHKL